uniref:Putative ovule protein n=1 Tax=Solanum chacoense TaxID=4108 RepID=A0A0V0HDX8_SOLCH
MQFVFWFSSSFFFSSLFAFSFTCLLFFLSLFVSFIFFLYSKLLGLFTFGAACVDTTWVWVWDLCLIWSTYFGYFDQNRWRKSGQFE